MFSLVDAKHQENMQRSIMFVDYIVSLNILLIVCLIGNRVQTVKALSNCGSLTVTGRKERAGKHPGGVTSPSQDTFRSPETIFFCRNEAQQGKGRVRRELMRRND